MASNKLKTTLAVTGALLFVAACVFLAIKFVHASRVASSPDIQGAWEGTVTVPGIKQRVVLKIVGTKGAYTATLDHIDMGLRNIPVTKLAYDYPAFSFELAGGSFEAKVNPGATEISGKFKQGKATTPVTLKRTSEPDTIPAALTESDYAPRKDSDVQGLWKGTLNVGQVQLRLNFRIAQQADGTFRAEMDSVDQGATALSASSAEYNRPVMKLEFKGINGTFQGEVQSGNTKMVGTWTQMGKPFPLTLERADTQAEPAATEADKTFAYKDKTDLQGHWKGILNVQKVKLHLALDIAKTTDGNFSGSLTSTDQTPAAIPATTLEYTAPRLRAEWKGIGGTFIGDLKSGKLSGTWKQGGGTFPVVFERN